MKSQKGMTMVSLILYVASFFVITATISGITTFFYNNIEILDTSIGSNSQYNKFNMYFLNECKKQDNELFAWFESTKAVGSVERLANPTLVNAENKTFITFRDNNGAKNSFIYDTDNSDLYYNSIKLCDDVESFQMQVNETTGKTVLKIFINIDGTAFSTEYVVNS